jgi:type II secretory pathway component GspD/PulD (secretin)
MNPLRRQVLPGWLPLLAAVASLAGATARAESLEAIPLHHRPAEELVPLLQPLLPPGAALTGTGDVLLVRGDAATVAEVRRALATLDRAPLQLLITVGQTTGSSRKSGDVRASGTLGTGDVQVGVNRPPADAAGADVIVRSTSTRDDIHSVSTVRALEGREVYVATGESRPVTTTMVGGGPWHGPVVSQTTDYRDAQTGFYATARVSGNRVTLEIAPTQQQFTEGPRQPTVAKQSVQTTVSGALGEWIEMGGVSATHEGVTGGLGTWGTRADLTGFSAWVKVERIP